MGLTGPNLDIDNGPYLDSGSPRPKVGRTIDEIRNPEPEPPPGRPRTAEAIAVIAIGGALGTALRYLISEAIPSAGGIPIGILVVNLTGAALLGFLVEALVMRGPDAGRRRAARLGLGVGVLGGYTTYSALATGTADLMIDGHTRAGLTYALATVVLGAAATWTGIVAAHLTGLRDE